MRGGIAPLTEARIAELLGASPTLPVLPMPPLSPPLAVGWWFRPVDRAALHLAAVHETVRDYSTAVRPRNVAGMLSLSCEDQEGRPCGEGVGLAGELDAAAGYGAWLASAVRLRAQTGRDAYTTDVVLDRGYVNAELGPIAAEVGRDVLVLGPTARTAAGWGSNAPPLDQLRLSGARPLAISPSLRINAVYVLGRLADPQTYPGDLVSIARGQIDIADRVELGMMQLLQLGGDGAPGFSLVDFLLEHFRRRDASASTSDSSNRRLGLDVAVRVGWFGGARITYQLMFEDLRHQVASALRYDADHIAGLETRWLIVELERTGERSQEHMPRITGFTTGGRVAGDPLGPAATAGFVGVRIPTPWGVAMPWLEVARFGSDTYDFGPGPISRLSSGPTELRFRLGARMRVPIADRLEIDPEAAIEDVERNAFVAGERRVNALLRAALVWRPG